MNEWASPPLVDQARRSETFRGMIRGVLGPVAFVVTHFWVSLPAADLTIVAGGALSGFCGTCERRKLNGSRKGLPARCPDYFLFRNEKTALC